MSPVTRWVWQGGLWWSGNMCSGRNLLINSWGEREPLLRGKGGKGTPGWSVKCMGGSCQRQSREGNPRPGWVGNYFWQCWTFNKHSCHVLISNRLITSSPKLPDQNQSKYPCFCLASDLPYSITPFSIICYPSVIIAKYMCFHISLIICLS